MQRDVAEFLERREVFITDGYHSSRWKPRDAPETPRRRAAYSVTHDCARAFCVPGSRPAHPRRHCRSALNAIPARGGESWHSAAYAALPIRTACCCESTHFTFWTKHGRTLERVADHRSCDELAGTRTVAA